MYSRNKGVSFLAVLSVAACIVWGSFPASASSAGRVVAVDSRGFSKVLDSEDLALPARGSNHGVAVKSGGVHFQIDWSADSGFEDPVYGNERLTAVLDTLSYLSSVLNHTGTCEIWFERFEDPDPSILSYGVVFVDTATPVNNGDAFEHITTGNDPLGLSDMNVAINFDKPWNAGRGPTPADKFDLRAGVLSILTYGLGIFVLCDGEGRSLIYPDPLASRWQTMLYTGNGKRLWDGAGNFLGESDDLLGEDGGVMFTGSTAMGAFGRGVPVYAPPEWCDLSLYHWKMPAYLLTPFHSPGPASRVYSSLERGALTDIGYSLSPVGPELTVTIMPGSSWHQLGERLELKALVANAQGPVTYQWEKEGQLLPEEVTDTIVIESLEIATAGAYCCFVTDTGGQTAGANLNVEAHDPAALPAAGFAGLALLVFMGAASWIMFRRDKCTRDA